MLDNNHKIWQFKPAIPFEIRKKFSNLSELVLQLLYNRGMSEEKDVKDFLEPEVHNGDFDPFLFKDMEKAVDLIIKHIKAGNKIYVYGDYDADGVTSSALLVELLSSFKADVHAYLPNRVDEGYGINEEALKYIAGENAKLVITVDCGIRNKVEVEKARDLGLEFIITDHHIAPEELPDCPIINPAVPGENYPFKYLAGVGVAGKLGKALISKSKLPENLKKALEERMLDLVAIGSVADCVPLLGENRVLVKEGLRVINNTRRTGLKELIRAAGIENVKIDSWHIGFQLGPRLNAAGRMDHANTAYKLLITGDPSEAAILAQDLNAKNIERQRNTEEIYLSALSGIDEKNLPKIIVSVFSEKGEEVWNEGVIGLVAGKLASKFYRPVLVITKGGDGYKGSGRSIPEFDIVEAMKECGSVLNKYGGHPAACGFSLSLENLDKFKEMINRIAEEKLKNADLRPRILIEKELPLSDIEEDLVIEVEKLAPFGQKNEKPIFASKGVFVVDKMEMGADKQHIKLRLKSEIPGLIQAIGFGQSERWSDVNIGDRIDIAYYVDINDFNGRREAQMKILDIKKISVNIAEIEV
jgi:single-stranded-DNA-specific exonuclease